MEQSFFSRFSSFLFQEKHETFSKLRNLTEGQNIWNASHSNILGAENWGKKWKYKKMREKKIGGNLDKKSFDKNGPYLPVSYIRKALYFRKRYKYAGVASLLVVIPADGRAGVRS